MEKESTPIDSPTPQAEKKSRQRKSLPLGLAILLIFSFVYNGLMLVLMVAGLFFPDIVHNILQQYYKQIYISPNLSLAANAGAVALFAISLFGLILLWRQRRAGIWYFALSQIAILATLVFVLHTYDWINIAIASFIIIIIAIYARGMK
jgi:asparagine N-glycosylation enzyme membrane subunit Stt3